MRPIKANLVGGPYDGLRLTASSYEITVALDRPAEQFLAESVRSDASSGPVAKYGWYSWVVPEREARYLYQHINQEKW